MVRKLANRPGGPKGAAIIRRGWGKVLGGLTLSPLMAVLLTPPAAAQSADISQKVKAECAACHTETGNSIALPFPKLAGLAPDYLAKQLRDFVSGARKNEIMFPIASQLSRADITALADYFSRQKRTPAMVTKPQLLAAGEIVFHQGNKENGVPACAGCHTRNGAGAPRFPMLAAQNPDYVVQQLQNFRSGARTNDFGKLMRTTVSRLTDDEIQAVAQYIASVPPPAGR